MDSADSVDELDKAIVRLLVENPKFTKRELATRLAVHEVTIAARINELERKGAFRLGAQIGFEAAGYGPIAIMELTIRNASVEDVANLIARDPRIGAVLVYLGDPQITARIDARSYDDVRDVALNLAATLPGVHQTHVSIIADFVKWQSRISRQGVGEQQLPDEIMAGDELDGAIVHRLIHNARTSNRALARILGVSESNVRSRIKRMESAKKIKIGAILYSDSLPLNNFMLCMGVEPGSVRQVAEKIAAWEETTFSAIAIGADDVVAFLTSQDESSLSRKFARELASWQGVRSVRWRRVSQVIKFNSYLIHID